MDGTLLQLKLKNYLFDKTKPQEDYFSQSYTNYKNFVKLSKKISLNSDFNFGKTLYFNFNKNSYGDLISNILLQVNVPDISNLRTNTGSNVGYTNGLGNAMIKKITLKIGGAIIEEHDNVFMDVYSSLFVPNDKKKLYNHMIKKFKTTSTSNFQGGIVQIPLLFWFNSLNGSKMTLPLVSLQNLDVELYIEIHDIRKLLIYDDDSQLTVTQLNKLLQPTGNMVIDFIILEDEDRLKYLNAKKQFYLITQSQGLTYYIKNGTTVDRFSLREFKYPVIELLWVIRNSTNINNNVYFNYTNSNNNDVVKNSFIDTCKLQFNSADRLEDIEGEFFYITEPYKYHNIKDIYQNINMLSFSNDPMNIQQPEGTCNFSNIYDAVLNIKFKESMPSSEINIYVINYNILQIGEDGQAYLLHSLSKSTPETFDTNKDLISNKSLYEDNNINNTKIDSTNINNNTTITNTDQDNIKVKNMFTDT